MFGPLLTAYNSTVTALYILRHILFPINTSEIGRVAVAQKSETIHTPMLGGF